FLFVGESIAYNEGPQSDRRNVIPRIFISYRRDDTLGLTGRIFIIILRYHAQFVRMDDSYGFEDLGAGNGSYVNGVRVSDRVPLKDGDLIHAGQVILIYRYVKEGS